MTASDSAPALPGSSSIAQRHTDASGAGRILQLDILRGLAILLVLGRHPAIMPDTAGVLSKAAYLWLCFGWTGVDLFFVLSGFLIGGLLFKELRTHSAIDVKRFVTTHLPRPDTKLPVAASEV